MRKINYWNSVTDENGYIHSIDMVYIEYFSYVEPKHILGILRDMHMIYPEVSYQEHLNRSPNCKYDYYLDGVAFGGIYVDMGKYTNYDQLTKTFDLLPMFQLRINPNKHMEKYYCKDLLEKLLVCASSGVLRKYDYAIDIKMKSECIQFFDSKKEPGLYKGTRYLGQSGRHGFVKVYDKHKEMIKRIKNIETGKYDTVDELGYDLTRVEHTLMAKDEKPILENIYVLSNSDLKTDYTELIDTDRAIVEMYLMLKAKGIPYDLKIGRRKMDKLKEYISGQYALLDYGTLLTDLIKNVRATFKATDIITDENGFLQVDGECVLPFD